MGLVEVVSQKYPGSAPLIQELKPVATFDRSELRNPRKNKNVPYQERKRQSEREVEENTWMQHSIMIEHEGST